MNRIIEPKKPARDLPHAKIETSRLSWLLWLIPVGAAALCVWFVYRDVVTKGPTLTLYFESAEGLQAENTQLLYRGAMVGEVKKIFLTKDQKHVEVKAQLIGSAKDLAREGSIFWIVRPEVKIGSISGLRTIISGEYIAVQPGTGVATNTFVGAEKEPIEEEPGALLFTLVSPDLDSVQEQSPIFYRGIQVGEVLSYQLGDTSRQVVMKARIHQEYAPLVRQDTKFWNAGGLSIHAGLFKGIQIQAESPKTIISGGIEFATPPDALKPVTSGATFVLNAKAQDEWKTWSPAISLQLPDQAAVSTNTGGSFLK
jgi:paraquat-inducible protein B